MHAGVLLRFIFSHWMNYFPISPIAMLTPYQYHTTHRITHFSMLWILNRFWRVVWMKLKTTSMHCLSLACSVTSAISVHVTVCTQLTYWPYIAFLRRKLPPYVLTAPFLMWQAWYAPLLTCSSVISADITLFSMWLVFCLPPSILRSAFSKAKTVLALALVSTKVP